MQESLGKSRSNAPDKVHVKLIGRSYLKTFNEIKIKSQKKKKGSVKLQRSTNISFYSNALLRADLLMIEISYHTNHIPIIYQFNT